MTDTLDNPKPKSSIPAPVKRVVPIVLVLAAVYFGYAFWKARQPYEWSGTVEARTMEVGSKVGGRIKDVLVREGDSAKAGQALVQLEPGDLPAQLLGAQGALDQAKANLQKMKNGSRPEEIEQARANAQTATAALQEAVNGSRHEQVAGAAARLQAAEFALEKATLDQKRTNILFDKGAASRADKDNADLALQSAVANRDSARDTLDELKNGSRREDIAQATARAAQARASAKLTEAGSRVEDIEAAAAAVDQAQGKVDQIKVQIDELVIRAPRAARVESLDLRPGDIIQPNSTAATLLEDDQLYVRIYVPETEIGHLKLGDTVPITVDSFANRSFQGVVEHINQQGEYSPRNLQTADERADEVFAARVGLREGRDVLRAGMAAFIRVPK